MDRRSSGVVLVAAVLIVAAVVPIAGGRRVTGSAQMAPVPAPPTIGDCLEALPSGRSALAYLPPVLAGRTGGCGNVNRGEIVSVAVDVDSFPKTIESSMSRPEVLACEPLVRKYLGWPVPATTTGANDRPFVATDWRPWNNISSGLLGPDLQQYFAGQRWLACVAYPEFAPYPGSIRGAVSTGRAVDSFAACLSSPQSLAQQVMSCVEPHQTELFGWATGRVPTPDLTSSCVDLVRRLTGMPDPTAGGALVINATNSVEVGTTSDASTDHGRAVCSVTVVGPRRLTSSLIGIGDKSLPWE